MRAWFLLWSPVVATAADLEHQVRLLDASGAPIDGTRALEVRVVGDSDPALPEAVCHTTSVPSASFQGGYASVRLTGVPTSCFSSPSWLSTSVGGVEILPRRPVGDVPRSAYASVASAVPTAASPTTCGEMGALVYDTVGQRLMVCDGANWDAVASGTTTPTKVSFAYTGADQFWTVPAGVSSVVVKLWGAAGGNENPGSPNRGGGGGFTMGTIAVTPGQVLTVIVGQGGVAGQFTGTTYGGGGAGTGPAETGMGGGRTAIRRAGVELATAGGGGGAGDYNGGGYGGGVVGGTAGDGSASNGIGGSASAGGANGGAQFQGGAANGDRSGGGGGGYWGGGGGRDVDSFDRGGGGGGSGYTGGLTNSATSQGTTGGNGLQNNNTQGLSGGRSDVDYPGNNVGNSGLTDNASGGHGFAMIIY
jgi:hypothetical protein